MSWRRSAFNEENDWALDIYISFIAQFIFQFNISFGSKLLSFHLNLHLYSQLHSITIFCTQKTYFLHPYCNDKTQSAVEFSLILQRNSIYYTYTIGTKHNKGKKISILFLEIILLKVFFLACSDIYYDECCW